MVLNDYLLAAGLVLTLSCCTQSSLSTDQNNAFANGLVTYGSSDAVGDHIQDIMTMWPHAFVVANVTVLESPICSTPPKGTVTTGKTTYCNVSVQADALYLGNWSHLERAARSSENFWIHYWYSTDKVFDITAGESLIVFLSPTHSYEAYAATAILKVTEDTVSAVRKAANAAELKR